MLEFAAVESNLLRVDNKGSPLFRPRGEAIMAKVSKLIFAFGAAIAAASTACSALAAHKEYHNDIVARSSQRSGNCVPTPSCPGLEFNKRCAHHGLNRQLIASAARRPIPYRGCPGFRRPYSPGMRGKLAAKPLRAVSFRFPTGRAGHWFAEKLMRGGTTAFHCSC
jgi:hypothetical protein